jgi:DNA-binding IclR family transcriptional regulator
VAELTRPALVFGDGGREAPGKRPTAAIHGTQTVARALHLLSLVVEADQAVRVTDLSKAAGIERSATYRLVRELEHDGFVARDSSGTGYVPGTELLRMAAVLVGRTSVRDRSRDVMVALRDATHETVSLHVRSGLQRVCLETVEGLHPIRRVIPLGETLPLYAGVSGKAILAFVSESDRDAVLTQLEDAAGSHARVRGQLDEVRSKGYLAAVDDRVVGVGGLAVPVLGATGVLGAITVSGPSNRWTVRAMNEQAPMVVDHVRRLSAGLGGDVP